MFWVVVIEARLWRNEKKKKKKKKKKKQQQQQQQQQNKQTKKHKQILILVPNKDYQRLITLTSRILSLWDYPVMYFRSLHYHIYRWLSVMFWFPLRSAF